MKGQAFIIRPHTRALIHETVNNLPEGYVVNIHAPKRTADQNAKMWAMLSDVARAKPGGRVYNAETWKAIFMQALGYELRFVHGLNGEPFPVGFKSSRLSKQQMADLITFIYQWGDENGVRWSEPQGAAA